MGRPLKIGVQLPEVERVVRWPELAEMARTAEQIGLDSIWLGDHLLYRDASLGARGPWEAWSSLAALAAVTERIQLGPLVAATSFHAPAMLAKMAATVDEISGGRLVLGLGAGWNEVEYRAFGFPFDQRISRFEEAFLIIRTLLREGAIDFQGRFYEVRDCQLLPPGARPGGPPLLVGSTGQRMLRITLPFVDAWNAWYSAYENRLDRVPGLLATVDAACRQVGRDPGTLQKTLAVKVSLPGAVGARDQDRFAPLVGTPEELAASFAGFAAAGVDQLQLVLDPITTAGIAALAPVLEALDRAGSITG